MNKGAGHVYEEHGKEGKERLLQFSDGIIAFAITLVTLSMKLDITKDVPTSLAELWPKIIGYLIAFVLVGCYWYEHHFTFFYINFASMRIIFINGLFLLFITFFPFTSYFYELDITSYFTKNYDNVYLDTTTFFLFFPLFVAGILLNCIWWYASWKHRFIENYEQEQNPSWIKYITLRLLRIPSCLFISIIIALFLNLFLNLGIFYMLSFSIIFIIFYILWTLMLHVYCQSKKLTFNTGTPKRLIQFSDCVIGISITLLAAQVEFPRLDSKIMQWINNYNEFIPKFLVPLTMYPMLFVIIGIHWRSHYRIFNSINRFNNILIILNFLFLLCMSVLFIPFAFNFISSKFLAQILYCSSNVVIASILVIIGLYASQQHHLVDEEMQSQIRNSTRKAQHCFYFYISLTSIYLISTFPILKSFNDYIIHRSAVIVSFLWYILIYLLFLFIRFMKYVRNYYSERNPYESYSPTG